jgi:hypothetical protein
MALHFVSTSVLSAKDNGEYTEELKDNDEVFKEKVSASKSVGKPLFEQLAEQAMKKQADYDANTKLIFGNIYNSWQSLHDPSPAPPRALDADDLRYYENLSEIKEKEILTRKANEDKEVELFLKAQHRQDRGGGHDGEHQAVTTAESSSSGSLFYSKHDDRSKKAVNAPKIGILNYTLLYFASSHPLLRNCETQTKAIKSFQCDRYKEF